MVGNNKDIIKKHILETRINKFHIEKFQKLKNSKAKSTNEKKSKEIPKKHKIKSQNKPQNTFQNTPQIELKNESPIKPQITFQNTNQNTFQNTNQNSFQIELKNKVPYTENENIIKKVPVDPSIVIMTVGNFGYLRLIVNWYRSIQKNTDMAPYCCLISYDQKLIDQINQQIPLLKTIFLEPWNRGKMSKINPLQNDAVSYKNAGWNEITLYKLHAIYHMLSKGRTVYYIDPDVYVIQNSLGTFKDIMQSNPQYNMLIQQGKPFCSGVIYAPPNPVTMKVFDSQEWQKPSKMEQLDDEKYIIDFFTNRYPTMMQNVGVLDLDRFPNGLKWRMQYSAENVQADMNQNKIDLLHFNYISGIENKITKMQEYNMYLRTMKIIDVPKQFMRNINEVCMNKNHIVYPPHQTGDQIELFAYTYFTSYIVGNEIYSEYDYLPIPWTAIAVENNPSIIKHMKEWLREFCKKNPNRKCWTIVQHCKGIEIAMDILLPLDWLVFVTSDHNAIKSSEIHQSNKNQTQIRRINKSITKSNKNKLPKRIDTKNHITIPLLSSEHIINQNNNPNENPNEKRTILASFIGDIHVHPIREKMQDVILNNNKIVVQNGNYRTVEDQRRFTQMMATSVFALCPRGYGNTSYRIVEAMQFGAIPVYVSDVFSLPYSDEIDWNTIAILVNENEVERITEILQSKTPNQIAQYQMCISKVYEKYFTMRGCCEYILRRIAEINKK